MDFSMNFFNNKLNNGINNSFQDWESYRNNITAFLIDSIYKPKSASMIILGAGKCNDINLNTLLSHLESLSLSDIDVDSIEDGIRNQGITSLLKDKITLFFHDYTGLEFMDFFSELFNRINTGLDFDKIISYIDESFDKHKNYSFLIDMPTYDVVVSLPVYTQLIYPQLEILLRIILAYKLYAISQAKILREKITDFLPTILEHYNKLLLKLMKKNGTIIVISDIIEYNPSITKYNQLSSNIDNLNYMKKWHELYVKKNGYYMGNYGLFDLSKSIEIKQEKWFVWPFNKERYFLVKGITN